MSADVQYPLRALTRRSPLRHSAVVRPDTEEQFQTHVVTQYTVGRLLSGNLPLRVYSFSCAVVRLRRMMFHTDVTVDSSACSDRAELSTTSAFFAPEPPSVAGLLLSLLQIKGTPSRERD